MKNSKLQELFRGFSDKNYKKAREFLNSPYFNKNPNFALLLDYIETFKSSDFPEKSEFYSYITDNKLCDNNIRVFISQFTRLIQSFLETEELNKKSLFKKTFFLNFLNRKNAEKSFLMLLNEVKKQQQDIYSKDEDYYYNQMYIELEELNFNMLKDTYQLGDFIEKVSINLDFFYLLSKLNLMHFESYYRNDLSNLINIWLKTETEKFLEKNYEAFKKDHPLIYAKYLILLTIEYPNNSENYEKLKEFAILNSGKLNDENLDYIFSALMNYAITKLNHGEEDFGKEAVELFFLMERFGIITGETIIDYVVFINIITAFLARNDINGADEFYHKYCTQINPYFSEDTLKLSQASLEFYKGDKDKAIKLLNLVSYKNNYFYLRSKTLLSKILYISSEYESIQYLCDATKHYLKRNKAKISITLFKLYYNYFSIAEKLARLKLKDYNNIASKKNALLKIIRKEKFLASRQWLIEKIKSV